MEIFRRAEHFTQQALPFGADAGIFASSFFGTITAFGGPQTGVFSSSFSAKRLYLA